MKTVDFSVAHPIEDTVIKGTYNAFELPDLANLDADALTKAASDALNKRILKARVNAAIKELRAQIKSARDKVREEFQPKDFSLEDSKSKLGDKFDSSVLEFANKRALRAAKKEAKNGALPEHLRVQIRAAKSLAKSAGIDPKVMLSQIQSLITAAKEKKAAVAETPAQ